jgi:hypothetical protein
MYENIKLLLKNKKDADVEELSNELYINYIKSRYLHTKRNLIDNSDSSNEGGLMLLFNKKHETDIQRECNGLILEKDTLNVICASQYDFESEIPNDCEFLDAEYCEDGTVLRLYYYNDRWCVATRKCIDARISYWSSEKSFDEMFWELFKDADLTQLNTKCTYLFILLHNENNHVVKHVKNTLVYTGCIDNEILEYVDDNIVDRFKIDTLVLPQKLNLSVNDSIEDNYERYFNPFKRGVILRFKTKENNIKYMKYDFKSFSYIKDIRGNEPSIRVRYLQLLSEPDRLQIFINYYPEHEFLFEMIYHNINTVCHSIYRIYRETHVKHYYKIDNTHLYFQTIKQLHAQFKLTNTPITVNDVFLKLKSLNPFVIKNLLGWVQ